MLYQKLRHSLGCSFPLKTGVLMIVVADAPPSVSLVPAIANALSVAPLRSTFYMTKRMSMNIPSYFTL